MRWALLAITGMLGVDLVDAHAIRCATARWSPVMIAVRTPSPCSRRIASAGRGSSSPVNDAVGR